MKTCKTHCKWCSNYWYAAIGFIVVISLAVFGVGRSGKTDVTTACRYDVGISGTSSTAAGSTAAFDVSIYPVNCTTEGDTSISITTDSTAATTGAATMPSCTPETSSVHLTTSGVVKTKINCATSATTANGYYMYYANFSPVNGATPTKTWFNFSVTGGNEACSGFNMSTDKSSYAVNEAVTVKYSCVNGKPVDTLKLQVCWPNSTCDEKSEILYTAKNVSGGSFTFPVGTNYSTNGSYLFRTCMYNTAPTSAELTSKSCPTGSTNSVSFNVTGNSTTTTNSCTSLAFALKDNKTTYAIGDMVNYSYSCIPAGTNAASVAIHLIKPDGSDVTYVTGTNVGSVLQQMGFSTSNLTAGAYNLKACLNSASCATGSVYSLPFTITGGSTTTSCSSLTTSSQCSGNSSCYWATKKSGTNYCQANSVVENCTNGVDDDGDEYIDKEDPACSNTTTTCPSGQYWSGGACVNDTTTSTACAVGAKCPSTSWCQNGQSFYYSTGELTCVAWSNDGTQPQAPTGTSACKPSDTNCVDIGQTVPYVSGKWCTRGTTYYSKDQMTCVGMNKTAPAGFSSCRIGDTSCLPANSYGPSTSYCSNSTTFYQKVKDNDPNNDKYCAEMPYASGTTPMTNYKNPEPPAGYGSCEPSSSGCKENGDKWSDSSSTYWCQNSQKCSLSDGGGMCVGWSESCPSGSKYCSATDTYCVEPGETKDISAVTTTTGGYSSYWCGGGGGMVFYSATKAYCEPRKADNTMTMMWTSAEVKAILAKLGAGWGLCPTKSSSSDYSSGNSRCLEPGQTGSSSDWCGWWPPSTTGGYYNSSSPLATRTCPALDDKAPDPIVDPGTENCPMNPTVSSCPAGQTMIKVDGKGKCGGYNYCKPSKETVCPAVMPIVKCPAGQTLIDGSTPDGCGTTYCSDTTGPMPFPEFDQCQMAKQQARGYKYELKQFSDSGKYLPEGTTLPEDFKSLLKSAREGYNAIDKLFPLGTKVVCTEKLGSSVQAQIDALRLVMDSLREKAGNVQAYMHCVQFQKELDERIKMLTEDVRRMRKSGTFSIAEELAEMKDLSAKTPAICKEADQYTIQDLYDERQDIEESISDKFNDNANTARDTFVTDTIYDIRNGMAEARQQIADKNLGEKEQCKKVENLFTQVETFIAEAQRTYDAGNEEEAGQILDKIFRFEEPVMLAAEQCGIDLDIDNGEINREVYSNINNLSNEQINKIVDKIVDRATERFSAILDEKIKQLTARIAQAQVSDKTQEQLDTSVAALQSVPKDARTDTEEAKNATLDTMAAFDKAKSQIKANLYARVRAALERATALNLFGESAEAVKAQAVALQLHAENGDVTSEDVIAFEQALTAAEKQNTVECYRVGGCRFRDIDPSTWYYSYLQNSTAFKGESDADGNRTGNVGPGRSTLRAEALVAIERTAGLSGVDRPCELTATGVRGVPAYANCAVNIAVEHGITFNGSLSEAATRDEVASWMVAFEKDNLPVEGSSRFTGDFRDMGSCRDTSAVSYIVANKIMTGYGGDRVGTWGCGQPLLRAELAAVLSRLEELLSLTRATPIIMD